MENTESHFFFKLLNLCKRQLSYEHHNLFLNACKEEEVVAKGLQVKKRANIEVVVENFCGDWDSVLRDASNKLQDLLLDETENVKQRLAKEILKIKGVIEECFGG